MLGDEELREPALALIAAGTAADARPGGEKAVDIEIAGYEDGEEHVRARIADLTRSPATGF